MLRQVTAAMLVATMTAGCYSVKRVSSPSAFIQSAQPENVWVAADNGEVFRLSGPSVQGDSVTGTVNGTSEEMTLSVTGNHVVFAKQKDPLKTASLVGAIGLAGGLAAWGFAGGGTGAEQCDNGLKPGGRPSC